MVAGWSHDLKSLKRHDTALEGKQWRVKPKALDHLGDGMQMNEDSASGHEAHSLSLILSLHKLDWGGI